MKSKFSSRLEVLLAKIAGKEASLSTMVPPWPMNTSEELMGEIADRIDAIEAGGGGGGSGALVIHPTVTVETNPDTYDQTVTETWDKTAREVLAAVPNVYVEWIVEENGSVDHQFISLLRYWTDAEHVFVATSFTDESSLDVSAATLDDYPTGSYTGR